MPKIIKGNSSGDGITRYQLQDNLLELARQMESKKSTDMEHFEQGYGASPMDIVLKQSEEILDVAREEARKIKEEAQQAGYKIGLLEGKEDGYWQSYNENSKKLEMDRERIMVQVEESVAELEIQKQRLLDNYLENLKDIAIAVAEKVMRVSLQSSGDIIRRMIVSATEKITKTQWVKIYISKYDAELIVEGDVQLFNSLSHLSDNIKIITMDREEQGTCIIELPKEIVDVSINTQMENIKGILSNVQL